MIAWNGIGDHAFYKCSQLIQSLDLSILFMNDAVMFLELPSDASVVALVLRQWFIVY